MGIEKDSNREAFEAWFIENGILIDTDFNVAKRAFEAGAAWQAAKAQAIPEGFVVVPKEPTQKMLDATINLAIPAVYVDSISGQHKLKIAAYYKAMINKAQEQANDQN